MEKDAIDHISFDEAKKRASKYDYALLYYFSDIELHKNDHPEEFNWEECQEARFFSEQGELHVFESENGMEAIEINDKKVLKGNTDDIIISRYKISGKFLKKGGFPKNSVLVVQEYLAYDEDDCQAYTQLTRLKGIESKQEELQHGR